MEPTAIAEEAGVTANTVRNRIERLQEEGIVAGYGARVRYEEAGYQLRVSGKCTAPVPGGTEIEAEELVKNDRARPVDGFARDGSPE